MIIEKIRKTVSRTFVKNNGLQKDIKQSQYNMHE